MSAAPLSGCRKPTVRRFRLGLPQSFEFDSQRNVETLDGPTRPTCETHDQEASVASDGAAQHQKRTLAGSWTLDIQLGRFSRRSTHCGRTGSPRQLGPREAAMTLALLMMAVLATGASQDATSPRLWNSDEVTFLRRPQPEFPTRASSSRGEASVICVVKANGTFGSCQIETETPSGDGFGQAAIVAMQRGARIQINPYGPSEGERVRGVLRFWNGR